MKSTADTNTGDKYRVAYDRYVKGMESQAKPYQNGNTHIYTYPEWVAAYITNPTSARDGARSSSEPLT